MEEWEAVDVEVVNSGLDATPSELHAAFEMSGDHLSEVRDRHTMMLVTSGELPESHIADIAPERRLNWIVEELNGKRALKRPINSIARRRLRIHRNLKG